MTLRQVWTALVLRRFLVGAMKLSISLGHLFATESGAAASHSKTLARITLLHFINHKS